MRWIASAAVAAALAGALAGACSGKNGPGAGTGGSGAGGGGAAGSGAGGPCEQVRAKVEQLYRAEAEAKEPKRVEEAVADNTAMVLAECARAPGRVAPCARAAGTAAELEQRCLAPLDDEGTEGEALRR